MTGLLKEWFAKRAGRACAIDEIRWLSIGYCFPWQLAVQPNPRLKEAGGRTPYARAYARRWSDEGHLDAQAGRIRSATFENADYDRGWIDGMTKQHQLGFKHERLGREFERLVRLQISEDLGRPVD